MPTAPRHPCSVPGCHQLTATRYCDAHAATEQRPGWASTTGSASSRGYGARWRKLRLAILRRDPVCVICRRKPAGVVDHITPKAAGGTDDEANLRGLCRGCHAAKTAQDAQLGRMRAAGARRGRPPTPTTPRPTGARTAAPRPTAGGGGVESLPG